MDENKEGAGGSTGDRPRQIRVTISGGTVTDAQREAARQSLGDIFGVGREGIIIEGP